MRKTFATALVVLALGSVPASASVQRDIQPVEGSPIVRVVKSAIRRAIIQLLGPEIVVPHP